MEAVLEAFAAERLLTLAADSVEISHEVLLTAWPLLRDTWLAETHADRIVRTRLHNAAAEWARHSRDPSYLYSGSLLQAAAETAARIGADPARNPPLSQTERDFLHASDRARRRTARRRHAVIAGLARPHPDRRSPPPGSPSQRRIARATPPTLPGNMPSPCPASSPPKASPSTPPIP